MPSNSAVVSLALAVVCATASGCHRLPSDDDLLSGLRVKRVVLDTLARLCQEDATTALWDGGHGVESPKTITWDREKQYVELFDKARIMGVRRTPSGVLLFQAARVGIMAGHTVAAGYAYSEVPPTPLVPRLADHPLSSGQQSYRAVDDKWYIFYSR